MVIICYPFKSDFFQSIMGEVLVEDETIDSIKTRLKHCLKVAYRIPIDLWTESVRAVPAGVGKLAFSLFS